MPHGTQVIAEIAGRRSAARFRGDTRARVPHDQTGVASRRTTAIPTNRSPRRTRRRLVSGRSARPQTRIPRCCWDSTPRTIFPGPISPSSSGRPTRSSETLRSRADCLPQREVRAGDVAVGVLGRVRLGARRTLKDDSLAFTRSGEIVIRTTANTLGTAIIPPETDRALLDPRSGRPQPVRTAAAVGRPSHEHDATDTDGDGAARGARRQQRTA